MSSLDDTLDRYDCLWREGKQQPVLAQFLAQASLPAEQQSAALLELIAIDMEYRWRQESASPESSQTDTARVAAASAEDTATDILAPRPLIEDYSQQWPEILKADNLPKNLIAEEFRIRHRWGDRPSIQNYVDRFGDDTSLREELEATQRELLRDESDDETLSPAVGPAFATLESNDSNDVTSQSIMFGRYRLIRQLGKGGMGEVYLAEDTQLERRIALKTPHLAQSDVHQQRFVNEGKAAATLHHPGICPVFDAGEIDGQPFITMAYIDGDTLREHWERSDDRSTLETVRIFAEISKAMRVAHDAGIVHRDLKPSNVMLDAAGQPVVMDFGLAFRESQAEGTRLTQTGDTFGSPAYMSPEQIENAAANVEPASDIYSLGVMLFEALTGRLPFTGTVSSILVQIARDAPPLPSQLRADIDPELEQLCLQMLAKDPAERPASMNAVAERLDAIVQRLQVETRSVSEGLQQAEVRPSLTRRVSMLIATALAPIAILLGIIVFNIRTPHGPVRIEVEEEFADQIRVRVLQGGEVVEIADTKSGWSLSLEEGEYKFELGKGGEQFEIEPRTVRVSRAEEAIVSVTTRSKPSPTKIAKQQDDVSESDPISDRPETPVAFAPRDYALSFDGIDDHVITPLVYDGSHPITVECWVTPNDPWENGQIFANRDGYRGFAVDRDVHSKESIWHASITRTGTNDVLANMYTQVRDPGPKTHLAFVWDGQESRLYVNGECQGAMRRQVTEIPASNKPLHFGVNWRRNEWYASLHGMLDEIRVSKVARYAADFRPAARHEPDADTWALYHCDESSSALLRDASGNGHDAMITGATRVPSYQMSTTEYYAALDDYEREKAQHQPERVGPALRFMTRSARIDVPPLELDFTEPFTVEAWAELQSELDPMPNPYDRSLVAFGIPKLKFDPWGYRHNWTLDCHTEGRWLWVKPWRKRTGAFDRRTHVAVQWDGEQLRLFVNGIPLPGRETVQGSVDDLTAFRRMFLESANGTALTIGSNHPNADGVSSGQLGGTIDRVRISKGARYDERFQPTDFMADESTVLLYDFHEGEGDVLHDLSGNEYHGTIVDAIWEPAPTTKNLPGLVASPDPIDGVRRWTIETTAPRSGIVHHCFSPDGKWHIVGSEDGYIRVYSYPGEQLHRIMHFDNGPAPYAYHLDWAPDSKRFVTRASDGWVRVWSVDGQQIAKWEGLVREIKWSPSGQWIAQAESSAIRLVKPDGTLENLFPLYGHDRNTQVSWAPDGQRFVASRSNEIFIGNTDGTLLNQWTVERAPRHLSWSPDGGRIAIVSGDHRVWMYSPNGEWVGDKELPNHKKEIDAGWSPNGELFAVGDQAHVSLFGRESQLLALAKSEQYAAQGRFLAWHPDGRELRIAKVDRTFAVHRVSDGEVRIVLPTATPRISSVDWNPRIGRLMTTAFINEGTRILDADGIPQSSFATLKGSFNGTWDRHEEAVYVSLYNDLAYIPFAREEQMFKTPRTVLQAMGADLRTVDVHPDGTAIAITALQQRNVRIIDPNGEQLHVLNYRASDLEFSPDGRWLAVCEDRKRIQILDTVDWSVKAEHRNDVRIVTWSADSQRLFTCYPNGVVQTLNLDGQQLPEAHEPVWNRGQFRHPDAIAVSDDERWIVWNRGRDVQAIDTQTGTRRSCSNHVEIVYDLAFIGPDRFVSCSHDGTIEAWDLTTGKLLWTTVYLQRGGLQKCDAVTFAPDGTIRHADPGAVDRLIYLVERESNRIEILSKTEFEQPVYRDTVAEEGYVDLFDGKTLDGWEAEGDTQWSVEDGVLVSQRDDKYRRLVYTKAEFTDARVRVECKLGEGGNSGVYLRTHFGEVFGDGYEAQITNNPKQETLTGGILNLAVVREQLVESDTWFTLEFEAKGDQLTVWVNGEKTAEANDAAFKSGQIALQASNKAPVWFRKVQVKSLD